ncbi:MAG: hypothetical protein ABSA16_07820 [Thermoguttaceae bacterium]|jgi:hypothetical protein
MAKYYIFSALLMAAAACQAWGQYPLGDNETRANSSWQKTGEIPMQSTGPQAERYDRYGTAQGSAGSDAARSDASSSVNKVASRPTTKFTSGTASLPNDGGQVWKEYDISAYTSRVTSTRKPEQAIIDWILRETGYEAWHSEPLGVLSANNRTLRVYHTPEMQAVVADLVDRFTSTSAATQTFALRVITMDSPNWRTKAQPLLHPVPVQTPGVCAWLLAKEDAAVMLAELRRRSDYREHSSPYLMVNNGQSTVVSAMRGRQYSRDVILRSDLPTGAELQSGQVEEGFTIDFSPLLSGDRRMIDATVKCDIDQVEKMIPILLDVPAQATSRQRIQIEEPQMTHYRFHERFRWPVEHVLLIGMGMVALPVPVDGRPLVPGVPLIGTTPARADLLVFIECKGQLPDPQRGPHTADQDAKTYRGRY